MRRRKREDNPSEGHDSFLDIVANLVGILIILVVVVGTQASTQLTTSSPELQETPTELAAAEDALREARLEQHSLATDNERVRGRIQQEEALANMEEIQRDRLQQLVLALEHKLEEASAALGESERKSIEDEARIRQLQDKILEVEDEVNILATQQPKTNTLQHHATPLAQTVFNDEVHFRLNQGHLAYVPMDELVDAMTAEVQFHVEKLRSSSQTLETVGPIDGFRMQYGLRLTEKTIPTELGVIRREQPEFIGFILLPARPVLGEPVETAIQDRNSELRTRLQRLDPQKTTVTIWVYPNSYDEYLQLETWLHEKGFLVASWPLPEGQPIAGGPNGYRSVAQ